jgi:hypothetical protein
MMTRPMTRRACPYCGRLVRVRKDGVTLVQHLARLATPSTGSVVCAGPR